MTTDATDPYPHADADADAIVGVDDYAADRRRLFDTDSSTLTLMQRITWVKLLKRPYLSAVDNPDEWETLLESRRLITTRLHDLLLDLHIDTTSRVAYKVRAPLGADVTAPNLLRNTKWTAYQTALLVVLRERLRSRTAPTDPVYADFAEIVDAMTHILPKTPDETRPATITRQELTNLSRVGIVKQVADDDRYRISPVLESLLPLPKLKQLLEALHSTNTIDDATLVTAIESTTPADTDGER